LLIRPFFAEAEPNFSFSEMPTTFFSLIHPFFTELPRPSHLFPHLKGTPGHLTGKKTHISLMLKMAVGNF
jgi:hypothetical protein